VFATGSSTGDRYVWPSVVDAVGRASHVVRPTDAEASGLPTWCESPCGSGKGFDLVAQDEVGAGLAGLGGGEVFTQLCDRSGGAAGRQGVEPDSQHAVAGVDVAAAG
jgi:hypothetical protein